MSDVAPYNKGFVERQICQRIPLPCRSALYRPGPLVRPSAGEQPQLAQRFRCPSASAVVLDDVSKSIIEELQQDGRRSYAAIGKVVGLSEAAVRQRVERLVDSGVMQVVAVTDPLELGFARQAMIGIRASGELEPIADAIAALPEVDYVVITAGSYDLLVEVVCESDEELLARALHQDPDDPSVVSTETFMYLQLRKQTYRGACSRPRPATGRALALAPDRRRRLVPAAVPARLTPTSTWLVGAGLPGSGRPTTAEEDPLGCRPRGRDGGLRRPGRNGGWCSALFPAARRRRRLPGSSRARALAQHAAMRATVDEVLAVAAAEGIDARAHKGGTVALARTAAQLRLRRPPPPPPRKRRLGDAPGAAGRRCGPADGAALVCRRRCPRPRRRPAPRRRCRASPRCRASASLGSTREGRRFASDAGNSAEHQPPLRPDAPKPAVSASSTTIRSVGSARQQVVGRPEPGEPGADDRDVAVALAGQRRPGRPVVLGGLVPERERSVQPAAVALSARPRSRSACAA